MLSLFEVDTMDLVQIKFYWVELGLIRLELVQFNCFGLLKYRIFDK